VLVVGGGVVGAGLKELLARPAIQFIETDVYFGPRTALICDGHDLPFVDQSIDGIIIQAVLGCVMDPNRCVAEMSRVLRPRGVVYAEAPFCQQVVEPASDFTRFTHAGLRHLFRGFDEIASGASGGPATALAWS
jgi:SAM-dependent methyltransferase